VGEDGAVSDAAQGIPWGTQWDLVSASDESVDWSAFLVTLGFQDGRAGGKAPVNRYFGMCAAGPDAGLVLGPFGMTMMAGPPEAMSAEASYVRLLEQVRGFRLGEERLVLLDADGADVAEFVPSADPE
jgi:heat shock protein HslJ